jgi:Flp pilus assembly protein TadD
MIACDKCQSQNALDSKFCKSCGAALSETALKAAGDKFDKMVQDGYALFNQGRTAEALLVAQTAVRENPNSANAHSLLGMCFEKAGQLAEALEAYEKVLAIVPESPLDRIKVTQLRHSLTQSMRSDTRNTKRFALIAGVAVTVLILAALMVGAMAAKGKTVASNTSANTKGLVADVAPFGQPNALAAVQTPTQAQPNIAAPPVQVQQQPVSVPPPQSTPAPRQAAQESDDTSDEPRRNRRSDESDQAAAPLEPNVIHIPTGSGSAPTTGAGPSDPAPADTKPASAVQTQPVAAAADADPNPGVIEIQVTHRNAGGGKNGGGPVAAADAGGDPNELQALLKSARNEFLLGHYESASKSYQRAATAGGDSGSISQRLGMCYQKMGKPDQAEIAYTHAISSYEAAINSGTGDSKRLKSALDSCKQALKLLKG